MLQIFKNMLGHILLRSDDAPKHLCLKSQQFNNCFSLDYMHPNVLSCVYMGHDLNLSFALNFVSCFRSTWGVQTPKNSTIEMHLQTDFYISSEQIAPFCLGDC